MSFDSDEYLAPDEGRCALCRQVYRLADLRHVQLDEEGNWHYVCESCLETISTP